MTGSLDLTNLLPARNRDKTLDSLLKNLFNRHLSNDDFVSLFGFVGDQTKFHSDEIQLVERDLEHKINQLSPMIVTDHASEKIIYTWSDLVQKMSLLGIDYKTISSWLKTKSYNFVPPIDLDKFCNFHEYFWIGNWILKDESLRLNGFPLASLIKTSFTRWNNSLIEPEYYVSERSVTDLLSNLVPPTPNLTTWSDWSISNLWIHKDDATSFLSSYTKNNLGFDDLVQAVRPIIEYHSTCRLNSHRSIDGSPSEIGTYYQQQKSRKNQLPLFDLYLHDGSHAKIASSIFYYEEGQQYNVDPILDRRVAVDDNNDFIFSHSLVNKDDGSLYFYKKYDPVNYSTQVPTPSESFNLYTIWRSGPEVSPKYSKYDESGTLINSDKFKNYKNYFWVGCDLDSSLLPSYNVTGLPEYSVIEIGGTSDWSIYNYWKHVSSLNKSDLKRYVQATKPIIEFNISLESQLITQKIAFNQLPKFRHFIKNQLTNSYNLIVSPIDKNVNDAYLSGCLLARVSDLHETSKAILGSSDILTNCFRFEGEYYIQGLVNGAYRSSLNGNIYGYKAKEISYSGLGNGLLLISKVDNNSYPEIISFTFDANSNKFKVQGTVTHTKPDLSLNTLYNINGITIQIEQGDVSFSDGDKFIIEISSYVYERESLYVNVNGRYRTISIPEEILNESQNIAIINGDIDQLDGTWEIPPQLEWNVMNETRSSIKQGDLYYHFISIIEAQSQLVGSSSGNNNWRSLLTKNVGLGGIIKQFDGDLSIFISLLIQDGITVSSLLEFARISYANLGTTIKTFVEDYIPKMISDRKFTLPTSGDEIDLSIVDEFKKFFASRSPIVEMTRSTIDDNVAAPFYDSTSSIKNLVVTLPYLGLVNKVEPKKIYDQELNIWMMKHHDGHLTQLYNHSIDLAKRIVMMEFERSTGAMTAGIVSGFDYPEKPYAGQFWFKTSTGELLIYEAISDKGELFSNTLPGKFSYDRVTNNIWQFNGSEWTDLGNDVSVTSLPWKVVRLDLIVQNLELYIEKELYDNCPVLSSRVNSNALENNSSYQKLMISEFENFGVKYGATDVYASVYDSNNPFTWNYSSVVAPGALSSHAAWQEIYLDVYSTVRPDLEPWKSCGYSTVDEFLAAAIAANVIPTGITRFSLDLWPSISEFVREKQLLRGLPDKLSVDVATGTLLPPYLLNNLETLLVVPPSSATALFEYGSLGPIERFWKKTLDYLYSKQKTYFKIDPLNYVYNTWGTKKKTVGEYILDPYIGKKNSPSTISLHGDILTSLAQPSWIHVNVLEAPTYDHSYEITCVSRIDGIFLVKSNNLNVVQPSFITNHYTDQFVNFSLDNTLREYFHGDKFFITLHEDGSFETYNVPQTYYRAEGLNQLYVQYQRLYGEDSQVSLNSSLLKDWNVKLGYRFSSMINTDNLTVMSNDVTVDNTAYNILLKENKFQGSSWLNALRVQLVVRGSTELVQGYNIPRTIQGGSPGDDWVFRVDNFNEKRTTLSWYEYNLNGDYQTFVALDGERSLFSWKKYTEKVGVKTYNSPFLITGIQNLINFIFGYSDKMKDDGWVFNDPLDPLLDSNTGRVIDYQLAVEQFIVQQFSNVDAGSAFVFNPFSNKVWFKTNHGTVSNISEWLGLEQETVCTVLDQNQKQISVNDIRVFRQDEITELVFDIPVYTLHLLKSEYEHVILFENYSVKSLLIYDSFIGQKTSRVFFQGLKQSNFTGRLDFGGHYLVNGGMRKNIESSIDNISEYYSTTSISNDETLDRARALLGFNKKQYFKDRGTTDLTEFRFWQGMISNKGTNFSVDAYLNSKTFKNSRLDEFWAYKISQYGESTPIKKIEMRVEASECSTERTTYRFIDDTENSLSGVFTESININGLIDVDVNGDKLFSYSDVGEFSGFELKVIGEWTIIPTHIGQLIEFKDDYGSSISADCFEIVNLDWLPNGDLYDLQRYDLEILDDLSERVYYEVGDFAPPVSVSDTVYNKPTWVDVNDGYGQMGYDLSLYSIKSELIENIPSPEYTPPRFTRINHSTIRIDSGLLIGHHLKVIAYGPNFGRYSPHMVFDYNKNVLVNDEIIWWDPARSMHHPHVSTTVDLVSERDPACYTHGNHNVKTDVKEKFKAWGESDVGTVWWNTKDLRWIPYSDTKIIPELQDRLSMWGSVSDACTIEVYEWVKSKVPPSEAKLGEGTDGEPAIFYYLKNTGNGNWTKVERELREARNLGGDDFLTLNFTFNNYTLTDLQLRGKVFVNEMKLRSDQWSFENNAINIFSLNQGDLVKVTIDPILPTKDELKSGLYKLDYPYVMEERRDEHSNLNVVNYYYWVKNKTSPGKPEKKSIRKVTQLLSKHDGQFAIPAGMKYYNQFNGMPNRHTVLSIINLGLNVRQEGRYKLRITDDPTLRNTDRHISLKNVHTEWGLIRINQVNRVPLKLWNLLIDTLIGETQLGHKLPMNARVLYDELNDTSVRYGFGEGQVLTDPQIAISAVKYTILNPKVDKYVNGVTVPDYIQYSEFNLSRLDEYFSTSQNIRKVMSDIWRNASAPQVNEIFFSVLEEAAAKNLEMSDFFKTSFISMNDIRTIIVE